MDFYFNKDADSGLAHCYSQHGIEEREVIEVLRRPGQLLRPHIGRRRPDRGRTLPSSDYREHRDQDYMLVITAYDLKGNAKQAYRRRNANE